MIIHIAQRERERDVAGQLSREYLSILEEAEKVEWKTIGEVCYLRIGRVISKKDIQTFDEDRHPVYSSQTINDGIVGYLKSYDYNGIYVSWTTRGNAGFVRLLDGKFTITANAGIIWPKDQYLLGTRFIYHWLVKNMSNISIKGIGVIPLFTLEQMKLVKIPIPPIETQNKIVKILDKFSELTEGTKNSLPKEIKLRKQQYEYYRNKLLDFPKE